MTDQSLSKKTAVLSDCRRYRYSLSRWWGEPGLGYAMFIGLNPSTADEVEDDPTIRRCVSFARSWGYGGLVMGNLFAYRATNPAEMMAANDPVGAENDKHLLALARDARIIVAAWGNKGIYQGRGMAVRALIPSLHALTVTKAGQPGHPLYLHKTLVPVPLG
ncbi:DUF1643 domain-containing protein [Castellaniella sp.]|uniref:DUF1643 domain-containing protein n=1 Tax=Castellaniella sp. TaxID=1955812 RepID=UPI003561F862